MRAQNTTEDFNQADVTHKEQWDRIVQSADLHD